MKKIVSLFLALCCVLSLTACFDSSKEYSGAGITVTLPDNFVEKEVVQAPFYLESTSHIVMGNGEGKSTLSGMGVSTVNQYIKAVLKASSKTAEVSSFTEGDISFDYAYYTSTVESETFGYMIVCLEGSQKFYSINFGCREKNLEKNKETYLKWAKTIVVE